MADNKTYKDSGQEINSLIADIENGKLGLPELQRPFVWENKQVRDLFDSMMRGYPIGSIMLWECRTKSKPIVIDSHSTDSIREVIIDGQQRLTALYAVMKGKKVLNSNYNEKEINISYCPLRNEFEVGNTAMKKDPEWIYNISELFTGANLHRYCRKFIELLRESRTKKGENLADEDEDIIADRISKVFNLRNFRLPVIELNENTDEEDVAEIFVRINSSGQHLKQHNFILTLLSVYLPECRRKIEDFCKQSQIPTKVTTAYNLIIEVEAQDIIRVVMAYAFDRARLNYGYKLLRGADFEKQGAIDDDLREQRLKVFKEKLDKVLDVGDWHEFLIAILEAGYKSSELLIYSRNALFFSYALYLIAKYRFNAKSEENKKLISLWFFCASLTSLYINDSVFENQLNSIKEMRTFAEYKEYILARINERLTNDYFNITLVGSDGLDASGGGNNAWFAYIASLIIKKRKVLFDRDGLLVENYLKLGISGKRKSIEKHHLFPKAYLSSLGIKDKKKINQMANYAYIKWYWNSKIKDEAPAIYYPKACQGESEVRPLTEEEVIRMEEENALPHGWENMAYEDFLVERRKLMAAKIREAFKVLKRNVI